MIHLLDFTGLHFRDILQRRHNGNSIATIMQVSTVLETGRELRGGTVDHLIPAYVNPSIRSVTFPFSPAHVSHVSLLPFYSPLSGQPASLLFTTYVYRSLRSVCFSFIHQLTLTHLSGQSASLLFTPSQASLLPFHSPAYIYPSLR